MPQLEFGITKTIASALEVLTAPGVTIVLWAGTGGEIHASYKDIGQPRACSTTTVLRMEELKLVEDIQSGGWGNRKFQITQKGREQLEAWKEKEARKAKGRDSSPTETIFYKASYCKNHGIKIIPGTLLHETKLTYKIKWNVGKTEKCPKEDLGKRFFATVEEAVTHLQNEYTQELNELLERSVEVSKKRTAVMKGKFVVMEPENQK
jgi:hypothetical protein